MRYVVIKVQKNATKKVVLVENPKDERYKDGVISQIWIDDFDGPPDGGQFYYGFTIEEVMQEFEELYDVKRSEWSALPDE